MGIGSLRRHPDRYGPEEKYETSLEQDKFEAAFEQVLNKLLEEGTIDLQKDTVQDIKYKVVNSKYFTG